MTAVEKAPKMADNPFAPEDDEDEPMEVSEKKDEVRAEDENSVNKMEGANVEVNTKLQQGPQWTNDELYRLMDSCEFPRTWQIF
jgi:hypothetical protein